MKMICLLCGNEDKFKVEKRLVDQLYHGEELKVINEVTVCENCERWTLTDKQTGDLLKNVKELYQNIYGNK